MYARSRHFGRNPATRALMRCRLGGANEGDLGHSRGDQGRSDRIAFRAQALAFLRGRSRERQRRNNVAQDARCIEHLTRQGNHGWRHRPQCVRRRFVGRRPDLARMESSRQRCRNRSGPCLAESKSQQARAQEHEARCCQGKKSVGDYVVVAHETPTTQMLVRIY
jgi:hypothetical protein